LREAYFTERGKYPIKYIDFKNRVLMLMHQYSIGGAEIAPTYNEQADLLLRIPALLDSAQKLLATTTRPIPAELPLIWDAAEQKEGFYIFTLPDDLWQLSGKGIPLLRDGSFTRYHRYHRVGKDRLAIPAADRTEMVLQYYRHPAPVPMAPDDGYLLDNDEDAQDAAAYYVAAMLLLHENPFGYSALYNEFESRRQQMAPRRQTEYDRIEDIYGSPGDGFYSV